MLGAIPWACPLSPHGVPCVPQGPPRCSSLQAPIMLLSGHEGEVYCCKFHPNGNTLASAGFDRLICEWPCCPQAGLRPCCWGVPAQPSPGCVLSVNSFPTRVQEAFPSSSPNPIRMVLGMCRAGHSPVSPSRGFQNPAEMQFLMLWVAEEKIVCFLSKFTLIRTPKSPLLGLPVLCYCCELSQTGSAVGMVQPSLC